MTTHVIEYNVKEAKIAEMADTRDCVIKQYKIDGNIESVKQAKKEPAKIRIAIEKKRKELKADALEYGRKVDSEAKKVSEPVNEIESSYNTIINEYEDELKRLAQEAQEKEDARIATINAKLAGVKELAIFSYSENHTSESVQNRINALMEMKAENFDYQEYDQEFIDLCNETKCELDMAFEKAIKHEKDQAELEAQRKKNDAERVKLEAEKAAFEKALAEANAKLEAEKQKAGREEYERKQAEIEKQRQIELQKERDELDRQRKIDEENRIKAEKAEADRIVLLEKEAAERKAKQEAEDRVRNASPQLFEALEELLKCDLRESLVGGYGYQIELAELAYITAGGDIGDLPI